VILWIQQYKTGYKHGSENSKRLSNIDYGR